MEPIRTIRDDLAIAGQISLEQLKQLARDGYRSVLNLRSPDETGYWADEQSITLGLNLYYLNLPLSRDMLDQATIRAVLQELEDLPKPVLVHCDTALRSAAIALIYVATDQGITYNQAFEKAMNLGLAGAACQPGASYSKC